MEGRAIRIAAAVYGKLVLDEAEELKSIDVLLAVMLRVGAVLVRGPAMC